MKTPSITALACCVISVGIAHAAPAKKAKKANWCVDSADITKAVPVTHAQMINMALVLSDPKSAFEKKGEYLGRLRKSADSICGKFFIMPVDDTLLYDAENEEIVTPQYLEEDEIWVDADVPVKSFKSTREVLLEKFQTERPYPKDEVRVYDTEVYGITSRRSDSAYATPYKMDRMNARAAFHAIRPGVIVRLFGEVPFSFDSKNDEGIDRRSPFARQASEHRAGSNTMPILDENVFSLGVAIFGEVLYNDSTKSILRATWSK